MVAGERMGEIIAATLGLLGVIVVPIAIVVLRFSHLKNTWSKFDVPCDLSRLKMAERLAAAKQLPLVLGQIEKEATKYTALDSLNYRLRIFSSGEVVLPHHPDILATSRKERDWPWSKPVWVVSAPFYRDQGWWWQYIVHEVFAHVAHDFAFGQTNHNHKDNTFTASELAVKTRLQKLLLGSA